MHRPASRKCGVNWNAGVRILHAKLSTTMEVYTQSNMDEKRAAQRKAVDKLLDRNQGTLPSESKLTMCSLIVPANVLQFPGKSL